MDIAANLDLANARALTDLRQYINSDLVFSDLKFQILLCVLLAITGACDKYFADCIPLTSLPFANTFLQFGSVLFTRNEYLSI